MVERTLTVITAGMSTPSSTRKLADRLAEETVRAGHERGVETRAQTFELRDVASAITDNVLLGYPNEELERVIEATTSADGLIAVSPIFKSSYAGLFKSFIDIIDNTALTDMPVLIAATGGTARHSLALDHAMRPLFSYMHSVVVPTGVYAASEDWSSTPQMVKSLPDRISRAAGELAGLMAAGTKPSNLRDSAGFSEGVDQLLDGFQGN